MEKQNRLLIFKNKKKITENHPDLNGKIYLIEPLPAGEYSVGLYTKESKGRDRYYSGIIRPAFKKEAKPFHEPKENNFNEDLDSDITF